MYFLELVLLLATILIQKECFAGDGTFVLENGPTNKITEYYAKDQCMAQPGYFHLHHFNFAFYLHEHQICGGGPDGMEGLLICYRSQLEKSALLPMGMQPTRQYELRNVAGNGVAERCQMFGPDWHGVLINTNDQRNWVFRFSTTNRTFTIDGGMEHLQWLFYKLASAKDVGESFLSKTFNPYRDFMKWKNDHFGEAEEADNRIRNVDNEKLKVLFMERQAMQERLQNYAGIWSLGLDMLPTKEGIDHLVLHVNISECCHIKAFFNQPTAQRPNPDLPKIDPKDGPITERVSIVDNFSITLDGFIKPEAKILKFEILDQLDPDKGMQFTVNFKEDSIIFQHKIDGKWTDGQKIKNHFVRGAPFHLEVILSKTGMSINVNCHGRQNLNAEIAFENPHFINITGDYKHLDNVNFTDTSASLQSWIDEEGLHGNNSGGIMLQGKIAEKGKMFTIKLLHRKEDESYESILQLEVGIDQKYPKLRIGEEECTESKCVVNGFEHPYTAGSKFEAIFKFSIHLNKIEIWMNNSLIRELAIDPADKSNYVHFVQIVGDDATAHMTKLRENWVKCTYEMSKEMSKQKSLKIVGKILPSKNSNTFTVQLITASNHVHIQLEFYMYKNSTNNKIIITQRYNGFNNEINVKNETRKLWTEVGEIFHLHIQYKGVNQLGLFVNEEPEIVFIGDIELSPTNFIAIFENVDTETLVIIKMDAADCSNLPPDF